MAGDGAERIPIRVSLWWAALALLLGTELLVVTTWFDTESLAQRPGFIAIAIGLSPAVLSIVLAFAAALLLMIGPRLPLRIHALANAAEGYSRAPWLALHAAVLWAFLAASSVVFDTSNPGAPLPAAVVAAWSLSALAVSMTWLFAMAPRRAWTDLAYRERRALGVAAAAALGAWMAGRLAQVLWKPLAEGTFRLVRWQLHWLYPDVVSDPQRHILGTPDFSVEISPSCSGYEGIGLIVVFVGVYLWLFRHSLRFPHALILLPISAAVIWLFNTARITALIAIGSSWSPDIAAGAFHSQAGWISFITVAMAVLAVTHRGHLFASEHGAAVSAAAAPPHARLAAALLAPFLVLLIAGKLTAAVTSGFDALYPAKVLVTAAILWHFRDLYRRFDWGWSWPALGIGVAVFAVWSWLEPEPQSAPTLAADLAAVPTWAAASWLFLRIVGSTLIVPLAEEFAFRGWLLRKLVARDFENVDPRRFGLVAFVASSLLFGLLHERWIAGTLAGMAYALAVYRRGRISDAVLAHATTNGLIALSVLGFGQWRLWS